MKKTAQFIICIFILLSCVLGKDNRISMTVGFPDFYGIEYQHDFNKIYLACSPHILVAYAMSRDTGDGSYSWIIVPSFSLGYYFIKRQKSNLALDLIIMPGYYSQRMSGIEETRLDLATALRLIPSFTFYKFTISFGAGFCLGYSIIPSKYNETKQNVLYPSGVLKFGINL
jgi:hypothetical protein